MLQIGKLWDTIGPNAIVRFVPRLNWNRPQKLRNCKISYMLIYCVPKRYHIWGGRNLATNWHAFDCDNICGIMI